VATTVKFKNINVIPFFSYKKLDAPMSNDSLSFISIAVSCYHRTPSEIRNRGSITNVLYGVHLLYNSGNLKVGATTFQASFDKPMIPNQQLYNKFAFSGESLVNSSVYYHYTFRNIYFFGEEAHSSNGG